MQLLLFSDLHANRRAAARMVALAPGVDVIVGAGDFGVMRRRLLQAIGDLKAIETPSVLVPGNAESADELTKACTHWPAAHVLHGTAVTLDGVTFFGLGGGIPRTPFGSWSYDFDEDEAEAILLGCPAGVDVLVTHSPPFGAVDRTSRGSHVGSRAIRAAIERLEPRLVVCGHIHDSAGEQAIIGNTTVINAGPDGMLYRL